jgi:hypothetical protein
MTKVSQNEEICKSLSVIVKLFVKDSLKPSVRAQFDYIRRQLSSNIEIVENYTLPVTIKETKDPTNQLGKIIRWLIPKDEFEGFRYVYMSDSDFLIVPEDPTLLDQHLMLMARADQVYTNPQRWSQTQKVSGLHFVETEPYFEAIDPILEPYRTGAKALPMMNNEEFLHTALRSAGIPPTQQPVTREDFDKLRPHPGYHLGCLRNYKTPQEFQALWRKHYATAKEMMMSPVFQHLVEGISVKWVKQTFQRLLTYLAVPEAQREEEGRVRKARIVSDRKPKQPVGIRRSGKRRVKQKAKQRVHANSIKARPVRNGRKKIVKTSPAPGQHTPPRLMKVIRPKDEDNSAD